MLFKSVCIVLLVALTSTMSYGKDVVKCKADLSDKLTKDGFARIILTCENEVLINTGKPLKMYVNKGVVVFDQTDVDKSRLEVKPAVLDFTEEQQPPVFIPAKINADQHKQYRLAVE